MTLIEASRIFPLVATVMDFLAAHAGWIVAGSVISLIVGSVLVPALILRIPTDYFLYRHRHAWSTSARHPVARLLLAGAKNLVGALFLVAGVALLFLPGQGLLTLMVGLMVMNYPGKFTFECWLVRRPHVLPALNWLRVRYGRAPLEAPPAK